MLNNWLFDRIYQFPWCKYYHKMAKFNPLMRHQWMWSWKEMHTISSGGADYSVMSPSFHLLSRHSIFVIIIIEVQLIYNVALIYAVKQSVYVYSLSYLFPWWFIPGDWIQLPVYRRTLLFIHSIHTSLHLLIPNYQSIPPPAPSLLATTNVFSIGIPSSTS